MARSRFSTSYSAEARRATLTGAHLLAQPPTPAQPGHEPCAARALPPLGRGIGAGLGDVSSGMSSVLIMWWRKEAGADAAMASRSASGHWCWLPIAWRPGSEHALAQWLETDFVCDRHGRRWIAAWRDEAERKASRTPRVRVAGGNCSNGIARSTS